MTNYEYTFTDLTVYIQHRFSARDIFNKKKRKITRVMKLRIDRKIVIYYRVVHVIYVGKS